MRAVQAASVVYTQDEVVAEIEAQEESERLQRRARLAAEMAGLSLTYDESLSAEQAKVAMWIGHGFTYEEAAQEEAVDPGEVLLLAQQNRAFIRAVNHYRGTFIQIEVLPKALRLLASLVSRDPNTLTIKDQLSIIGHITKLTSESEDRQFKAMKVAVELEQRAQDAAARLQLLRERGDLLKERSASEQQKVEQARRVLASDGTRGLVDITIGDSDEDEDRW